MARAAIVSLCMVAAGLSTPVEAGVIFFTDPGAFESALATAGKVSKGSWDFKPDLVPPDFKGPVDDPLNIDTLPPAIWTSMPLDNVTFQSNTLGINAPVLSPSGIDGLGYFKPGHPANTLGNNILVAAKDSDTAFPGFDSFDILSGVPFPDNHTAMALELAHVASIDPTFHVTVFDKDDVVKGKIDVFATPMDPKPFLGILMTDGQTIGRVNIFNDSGGKAGISSIAVYVPAPGPLALLGLAGLMGTRRRRRR